MNYPAQPYGQPYPAQQYPQAPAQQAPQYAPPAYPQQPAQQYAAPQQQPQQPLAQGSIDDFYSQPSAGGGPSISWKDKPIGTTYAGIVSRDVTHADIQQQTDFNTKQPQFYKDGRPKFVMKVPLRVQPSPEFPEGEATLFVRGQMRDELVRAMSEAGVSGAPTAGSTIVVSLSGKRNSGQGLNPANQFTIQYTPVQGATGGAAATPPAAAPSVDQAPVPQQATAPEPPAQYASPAPQAAGVQAPVPQAAPQPPAGLSPEQQELLARLTGGQQGQPGAA